MRPTRRLLSLLSLVAFLLINQPTLASDSEDDSEEYDVTARVARISHLKGTANLRRDGDTEWEPAAINFPLVEGDTVATARESQIEIQLDARNFIRLSAESALKIVTLREEGVALSIISGTVSLRLAALEEGRQFFEIDAPKATLAAERTGLYRVDVSPRGLVKVTVRGGGRARIYSETSGFTLREGRAAELLTEGERAGDWNLLAAGAPDLWDVWVEEREQYLAQHQRFDTQYHDPYVWGSEDLDSYGAWNYTTDYGWLWRPHASSISGYQEWAPYRFGNWVWCPPYGWTWVGSELWGWAPYHYGRWVYYNNHWAWCPRSSYYRQRSWWRPALVAFNISFGDNIYWYPLSYHHRDPRARSRYRGHSPRIRSDHRFLWRRQRGYLRGVTGTHLRYFGSGQGRFQGANGNLARRVLDAEPFGGVLPVRPAHIIPDNNVGDVNDRRFTTVRNARRFRGVSIPDWRTGALNRAPGVRLGDELRRFRMNNGRELRPPTNPDTPGTRPSGVLPRPGPRFTPGRSRPEQRPVGTPTPPNDRDRPNTRPRRPERPNPNDTAPPRDVVAPPTVPTERPPKVERRERIPPSERQPVAPTQAPKMNERREPQPRIDPPVRYDPAPRKPDSPPRVNPPQRNDPPARSEPPRRSDPPPRRDPPSRNDPPARSEPPPRNEPPRRSDPPPRRDPPSRNDPPARSEPPPRSQSPRQRELPKDEPPPRQQQPRRVPDVARPISQS